MRVSVLLLSPAALAAVCLVVACYAQDMLPNSAQIAKLTDKVEHADLRDRPYLYAHLLEDDVTLADHEIAAGDTTTARTALQRVRDCAQAIETSLEAHTRKLQDTEILLRKSAFRLHAAMMSASLEDRPAMDQALTDVNRAENKVMSAVFAR